MTVEELIKKLQEFPLNAEVVCILDSTIEYDYHYPRVEHTWGSPDIFISGGVVYL